MRETTRLMLLLAAVSILWRIFPHPWNMTPVASLALFSGAKLQQRWLRFLLPLLVMLVSDSLIGFHIIEPFVYLAMLLAVGMGMLIRRYGLSGFIGATLVNAMIFFLFTNAAVCFLTPYYSHDFAGLLASYTAGLPFLAKTAAGDLFFTLAFYAVFRLQAARESVQAGAVSGH